jgi:hypothetical protein
VTKRVDILRADSIDARIDELRRSAIATRETIADALKESDALNFVAKMKFEKIGHDPLHAKRPLNLIEQLNQTFTYLASFRGAQFLFNTHPHLSSLRLNLGNVSGWDLESSEDGGIVAEVFAAVTPSNNQKLNNDIKKVAAALEKHRYVIFMSPSCEAGKVAHPLAGDRVTVWSLGALN